MKANELRIGNYVNYYEVLTSVSVVDYEELITVEGVERKHVNGCYDIIALSPIEITEEWLLMFGFEQKNGIIFNNLMWSYAKQDNFYWYLGNPEKYDYSVGNIKHIHQLQNLYFALTGEELTLKQ